jgi:cation diffusion facilitator family transporter
MAPHDPATLAPSPALIGEGPDAGDGTRRLRAREIRRVLGVVLVLNLLVAAAKLGYGVISGSVAMTADGVQSLLDGLANVIGLVAIALASRPPDRDHPYGHERYETLASIAIAVLMTIGVLEIVETAIGRWQSGERPTVTAVSFAVLLGTMAVNAGVSVWERRAARRLRSDLLAADARHTASDVLVSGAVVVGLIGEAAGIAGADAAVSLVVAVTIAWAAWGIVRDASMVLTDAAMLDPVGLLAAVLATPQVETAHNLRLRSSGGRAWVDVHVTVDPALTVRQAHDVANRVEASIRAAAGPATEAIIHVEPAEPPHTRPDPLFGQPTVGDRP